MDGLIEPYLIKAISLLHSSAKDSGDQLKAMLDEAIRLKNETSNSTSNSKLPPPLTNRIKNKDLKTKTETFYDEDIPLSKRRKESPRSSQPSSPATSSPHHSRSTSPNSVARRIDDLDSGDADDLAQEIMQDIHCVVCNGITYSAGNQLVECQECHSLYHQECHRPSISDSEVNDPRSVFFCSDCNKPMSKNKAPGSSTGIGRPKSSSPIFFVKSRSDSPSSLIGKNTTTLVTGFNKQATIKSSSGTKSSGSSSSSSSSGTSSSNNAATVNSSLINADKRLQNIKKRAANKLQEKRKTGGK